MMDILLIGLVIAAAQVAAFFICVKVIQKAISDLLIQGATGARLNINAISDNVGSNLDKIRAIVAQVGEVMQHVKKGDL